MYRLFTISDSGLFIVYLRLTFGLLRDIILDSPLGECEILFSYQFMWTYFTISNLWLSMIQLRRWLDLDTGFDWSIIKVICV